MFFRDSTRRQAEQLAVGGWVTNRDDGAVEAVFEGDVAAIESMVEFCRSGPGEARVDSLDVSEESRRASASSRSAEILFQAARLS